MVSNAFLNTPWPKVEKLRQAMVDGDKGKVEAVLGDVAVIEDDSLLPETGYDLGMERMLSAVKIVSSRYHTRYLGLL